MLQARVIKTKILGIWARYLTLCEEQVCVGLACSIWPGAFFRSFVILTWVAGGLVYHLSLNRVPGSATGFGEAAPAGAKFSRVLA